MQTTHEEVRDSSQPSLNAAEVGLLRQEREHLLTQKHRKKSLMTQRIQHPDQERINNDTDTTTLTDESPSIAESEKEMDYFPQEYNPRNDNSTTNNHTQLLIGTLIGLIIGLILGICAAPKCRRYYEWRNCPT